MEAIYELDERSTRPLILLDDLFPGCTALLDTGARIAMWTKKVDILQEVFAARLMKRQIAFSGFGGETVGDIYELDLSFGMILYPKLRIIASRDDRIPGYFLFSASMFEQMIYTIDKRQNRLIIDTGDNQVCQFQKETDRTGEMHILTQ